MYHKYGEYDETQINSVIHGLRKQIFFLLLCVDKRTRDNFPDVDVNDAFCGLLFKLGGLNSDLFYPTSLVETIALLEEARLIYSSGIKRLPDFLSYRKCILDAGNKILEICEEVYHNA